LVTVANLFEFYIFQLPKSNSKKDPGKASDKEEEEEENYFKIEKPLQKEY
jgi:hypothetical protein